MRHSSTSWAWSRSEASVLLIIDDRSQLKHEQWWMGNSLSGLLHFSVLLEYTKYDTDGVGTLIFHVELFDVKVMCRYISVFQAFYNETSIKTVFTEFSVTTLDIFVLENHFLSIWSLSFFDLRFIKRISKWFWVSNFSKWRNSYNLR